jgi:hypothetical protein
VHGENDFEDKIYDLMMVFEVLFVRREIARANSSFVVWGQF